MPVEISQEAACHSSVLVFRRVAESAGEGLDGAPKRGPEWMDDEKVARRFHDERTGSRRICWATARAYC